MAYIGSSPTKVISRQSANIFTYTAVANQVAFTGSDANGNTLACTPSDIMVHMNGLRLEESDFTATTTTVTLGSGAAAGDEVTITAFVTFETADAYTKSASDTRYVSATGGTFTGDVDFGANKITYANVYAQLSDLPSASTYHGMFAHVHATGLAYYAHAGAWIPLANTTGANFTGDVNFAAGADLTTATAGTDNLRLGENAGDSITSGGNQNVTIGKDAGTALTTADDNVAVGYLALKTNTGSNNNVAVGSECLEANTAANNTGVGYKALHANTSGANNTGLGSYALVSNTTGSANTAVGNDCMDSITTGGYNTAIGVDALQAATTASSNNAMGSGALTSCTTGSNNIAIGNSAGDAHTTAQGGTYIGHAAGYNSNAQNTVIGFLAAYSGNGATSLTTGGGNTLIGAYTGVAAATNHSTVILGHNATGKGSNTGFINPTSGVYQGNNSSSWSQTSDQRLKKNITDSSIGLAEINQLKVRNFEYKTKDDLSEIESAGLVEADIIDNSGVQVGAIAQEIQAVLPKCVTEQDTGVLSLNTDNLTWHLIKAVQELSAKNDALETENTAVKARLDALEGG